MFRLIDMLNIICMMKFNFAVLSLTLLTLILGGCTTQPARDKGSPPESSSQSTSNQLHVDPSLQREEAISRARRVSQVSYDLNFDLTKGEQEFSGAVKISFSYKPGSEQDLRIDYAKGKITEFSINGQITQPAYDGFRLLAPASMLKNGINQIKINFVSPFSNKGHGLVIFKDPQDQRVYAYTQLEPYDANRVFPCFDQPDLKATYAMQVKVPSHWQVISSVRESKITELSEKAKLWTFPTSARFSTYVWSLHSGPFKSWSASALGIPMRLFVRQSLAQYVKPKEWFTFTEQGLAFFNQYFNYPYPYLKYDQLVVPEFSSGAMENVAAVTFNESFIHRGPKSDRDRLGMASTILHEMAHMWFGDLVTMKWWNDLWLNESFATYMSALALSEATEFREKAWRHFYSIKNWAYTEDQLVTTHPIEASIEDTREAFSNFDGITYGKGASVIKQLSYFVGAKKFQKGIQNYIKKFAEGNTELKDFIDSIGDAYGSDLSEWQKQWLQTASLNTIGIKLKCDRGKIESFYVEQEAPQAFDVLRSHRFKIALFQSKSSRLMTPLVFSAQISDQETSVPEALGKACPALIYPNYEDYGYMKLKLDSNTITELPSLIRQLPRAFERQLFWAALWDMVEDTHLDLVKFGELATQNLNKEKDPETLRAILRYLHGYYSKGSSVLFYLPKDSEKEVTFYNRFVSKLEGIIWQQLLKAKPNSEHQKIWLLSFIETARTPNGLNHLNQLLSGKVKLKGLPIDQDKRWEIIVKLASFNFRNSEILIAEEAKRDPSSSGKLGMLSAQASIPLLANKESWLNEIEKEDSSYSLDQQRAIINELFPAHQISLETQAGASFYDRLAILAQKREGPFLVLYSRLIPNICAEEQNIKIGAFLKENLKLHPGLEKRLKVYRELGDRCRDIRSLVRKEHETRAH